MLLQGFMCQDQILLIAKERTVYNKENAAGICRTSSFYLARVFAEFPSIVLFSLVAGTITYFMYGFQKDAATFFPWCVIVVVVTDAGGALLTSLGALAPTMEAANLVCSVSGHA